MTETTKTPLGSAGRQQNSGRDGRYYDVIVTTPLKGSQHYTASCIDVICALRMTFEEGEAFKAIWRKAAARLGLGKADHAPLYDAEKAAFYGGVMEKLERGRK